MDMASIHAPDDYCSRHSREMMILLENLDARRLIHSSIIRGDDDETWSVKLPSIDPENGRSVSSPIILRIHDLVNVMFYLSG